MILAFSILLLLLALYYAAVISSFAVGFRHVLRRRSARPSAGRNLPFVSVIIPARDESLTIGSCLTSILNGTYPKSRFEVIVVDDLSRDDTAAVVERLQQQYNRVRVTPQGEDETAGRPDRLRLLRMPENLKRTKAHKKRAIEKGIAQARGDIILTTDADCVVPKNWIRRMAAAFDAKTAFVSGPVLYRVTPSPMRSILALDYLGLIAVGAGAIGIRHPNVCNGANVAYRRDVFLELGGFSGIDHLTSGDDELLMQKIARETSWKVRFCPDQDAVVLTDSAVDGATFFEQRRRWASKGAHYPSRWLVALIVGVYLFYAALLSGMIAAPFVPALALPVLAAFGLKMLAELTILAPACRHFNRVKLLAYFLPAQLLHVPYIVVVGAAGAFGGYKWKGRIIER